MTLKIYHCRKPAPKKKAVISDDDSFKVSDDSGDDSDFGAAKKSIPAKRLV